jgi:hypothetical protein
MRDDPQRIETEHVEVRRLAERLAEPGVPAALRRDVHALLSFLPAHLHREERPDGVFANAVARAPEEAWRLEAIRDRHARMLEELEALLALVEREDADDAARVLARELAHQLLDHEHMEAAWLHRVRAAKGGT